MPGQRGDFAEHTQTPHEGRQVSRRHERDSADSLHAAILPLHYLQQIGIRAPGDCTLRRFDSDWGKHGDTGSSELAVLTALRDGEADAGALAESTWQAQVARGTIDTQKVRIIWTSPWLLSLQLHSTRRFPR